MKFFFLIFSLLLFTGCSNEVEKCVSSQVEGWKAKQERLKDAVYAYPDYRSEAEVEAQARLACLKAVSKQ
jgi:outer membrane murein-binding lipoprotein Lpp